MSKEADATWDRWIAEAKQDKEKQAKELEKRPKEVINTNVEKKTHTIPDGYYESEEYKKFCEERTKKYEELTGQSRTQYIDDQLKIKEETIKGYEKIKKEAEENSDKNIWDNDYVDMRKLHFARLEKYGRSTFNGETYYVGSKGGIYTLSANGTRNYKY